MAASASTTPEPAGTLLTVGHSTRPLEEFVALLRAHGVEAVVDVRRFPGSRRHPQFGQASLAAALADEGVAYAHEEALGGRREGAADSPNGAWRNASFRAYADHLATPEFGAALDRVLASAACRPTAVMCAEAVPWRCHRRLIADAAFARGWRVLHLMGPARADRHALHPDAHVRADGTVVYPPGGAAQADLF